MIGLSGSDQAAMTAALLAYRKNLLLTTYSQFERDHMAKAQMSIRSKGNLDRIELMRQKGETHTHPNFKRARTFSLPFAFSSEAEYTVLFYVKVVVNGVSFDVSFLLTGCLKNKEKTRLRCDAARES